MPSRAIEAMDMAVNALALRLHPTVHADVRKRWMEVERGCLTLLAEVERLREGLTRLCECGRSEDDPCRACRLLRGVP
jgi:hypothetical protein